MMSTGNYKSSLKKLIQYAPFWQLFKIYAAVIHFLNFHKTLLESDLKSSAKGRLQEEVKNLTVLSGPFKGMKYPELKSYGSAIFAKLFGTYEFDISDFFTSNRLQQYDHVIDVGCAEGYYAIGACLLNGNLSVTAVDKSQEALDMCRQMAHQNSVENQVSYLTSFNWTFLQEFMKHSQKKVLIICDCEGCEIELFDQPLPSEVNHCDLIIELHDFIHPGTKEALTKRFAYTHSVKIIKEGSKQRKFDHLQKFSRLEKELIIDEERPKLMEWMIAEKKG